MTTRTISDSTALDMMREHLTSREWDASDIERVAEIIGLTGREISDPCGTCGGISSSLDLDDVDLVDAGGPCPECDPRFGADITAHAVFARPGVAQMLPGGGS